MAERWAHEPPIAFKGAYVHFLMGQVRPIGIQHRLKPVSVPEDLAHAFAGFRMLPSQVIRRYGFACSHVDPARLDRSKRNFRRR